ncbi:MAG TPA: protein translocase subunit SecD [Candidatus Limnocylindrales bacterium]
MRRAAPLFVVVFGLLAVFLDVVAVRVPIIGAAAGTVDTRKLEWKLGLDLQGGFRVEYQAQPSGDRVPNGDAMNTIRDIIERRVNATGVSEPIVYTVGSDRIVVELPGTQDAEAIEKLVGTTGRLDFVPLPPGTYGSNTATSQGPTGVVVGQPLPVPEAPLFSGDQLDTANPATDTTGQRAVSFTLHDPGKTLFADYSSKNINNYFAIVLDGKVVSAPFIQSAITGGTGQISGQFTAAEMNNLVTVLRYGSLPFEILPITNDQIPATLGLEFLHQTLTAAIIGIALVFLFMLIYYRLPGAVASFALVYYATVVLAVFRLIPVTLTLAGIAGFVLSVGMAVDANILIFERSKEELRLGKPLAAAIEAGFNRAWNSILDSNVSSLITAGILYWFGSSTIRGFAFVLIIGVLTSMFTAITVTRTVLRVVVQRDWARKASLFGVREDEFVAGRTVGRGPLRGEARGRV